MWTTSQHYDWARANRQIENRWRLPSPPAKRCEQQKWGTTMARLPSHRFIIQSSDSEVVLFEKHSEREIVRFNAAEGNAMANAQRQIYQSEELDEQDKSFAHFWCGYFYAFAAYPGDGRVMPEWARTGWDAQSDPRACAVLALYDEFAGDMTESTDPESRMGSFRAELAELLGCPPGSAPPSALVVSEDALEETLGHLKDE